VCVDAMLRGLTDRRIEIDKWRTVTVPAAPVFIVTPEELAPEGPPAADIGAAPVRGAAQRAVDHVPARLSAPARGNRAPAPVAILSSAAL
jgi:hypothetical protein